MAYKLRWLDALRAEGERTLAEEPDARTVLVGDFNVAPYDEDVWDMAAFEGRKTVTAPVRAAFHAIVDSGYDDVVRPFNHWPCTLLSFYYIQSSLPKHVTTHHR